MKLSLWIVKINPRLPIFRSPEQERLLTELFVFAAEPISLSELARRAGTSVSGAHKEVERLEASGLVRSVTEGRGRMVIANDSSPLYGDLRRLLLKISGPEPLLRSALSDVDGIREAFIYGSWADPSRASPADIDVMVIGGPEMETVYDAVEAVEAQIGRSVNVTVRSPVEWDDAEGAFERAVKSGPKVPLT